MISTTITNWQQYIILAYTAIAIVLGLFAIYKCRGGQSHQKFALLLLIGSFVWGDALIFSAFWALAGAIALFFDSWFLFQAIFLVFWLIRSAGETIYWLMQQFSNIIREKPEKVWTFRFVKSNAAWFLMQIWWQTITIASLVLLILLITSTFLD